ncbi:MAG: PaaI family thioesterase [Sneathiella sp.]|nr:PaaI family thioesterase [Sneathiella sp.]
MDNQDFVNAILDAKEKQDYGLIAENIPYLKYLGLTVEPDEKVGMIFHIPENKKFTGNPVLPALHGGVVGAFMESAALIHLIINQEVERLPKIITFTTDYLRSARVTDLYAEAFITKPGRRVVNIRVRAWQEDRSKPVATANANFLVSE